MPFGPDPMPRSGYTGEYRAQHTIQMAAKLLGVEPDSLTEEEAKKILQDNVMRNDDVRIRKAIEDTHSREA
jgi:hypothetical protein